MKANLLVSDGDRVVVTVPDIEPSGELLTAVERAAVRDVPRRTTPVMGQGVVAAEQHADRTVLDLAAELGISLRTLEIGFRRELHTTPHEYLRTSRLARVHEELARADAHRTTVSTVAYKWGFANPGRFARAYREMFGESPAQTLRS